MLLKHHADLPTVKVKKMLSIVRQTSIKIETKRIFSQSSLSLSRFSSASIKIQGRKSSTERRRPKERDRELDHLLNVKSLAQIRCEMHLKSVKMNSGKNGAVEEDSLVFLS